jgi:hypothetical protein
MSVGRCRRLRVPWSSRGCGGVECRFEEAQAARKVKYFSAAVLQALTKIRPQYKLSSLTSTASNTCIWSTR